MNPSCLAANALWWGTCAAGYLRYRKAMAEPALAQRRILTNYLRRNAQTVYGRRHGFAEIDSPEAYRSRVPLTTYEDYVPYIERIAAGEPDVLTRAPVRLLEPSSGSTAPAKLIPYTDELRREFGRAIAPWVFDLFRRNPGLVAGRAYWSVTPAAQRAESDGSHVPVGFEEDTEYLGGWLGRLVDTTLAVPGEVRHIEDMDAFRYVTLLFLLRCEGLRLISVWNPTFLTLLVEKLPIWWRDLTDDLERGGIFSALPLPVEMRRRLESRMRPCPNRAMRVRAAFETGDGPGNLHRRLWPNLQVISCWTDANARPYAAELSAVFPQARLQGKGLIATEGFVSAPIEGHGGAPLAVRSHFFEFLPEGDERTRLAHELDQGQTYSVVLTTAGGLYRYRLQDLVRVVGHVGDCPVLGFLGKEDRVSDWFGEKLNERHVRRALAECMERRGVRATFAMVACETEVQTPAYTLFVEAPGQPEESIASLSCSIEAELLDNYHYRYCRDLGQLGPLQVFRIEGGAIEAYANACRTHGQRVGDVKPACLSPRSGWTRVFRGRVLAPRAHPQELETPPGQNAAGGRSLDQSEDLPAGW